MVAILLLLVVNACLLVLAIVHLHARYVKDANTIRDLRREVWRNDAVIEAQAEIMEDQARQHRELQECFDDLTDLSVHALCQLGLDER